MTKLTRIEEVKKIEKPPIISYSWGTRHDAMKAQREADAKYYTNQLCQLFPQPLDDKELREKVAKWFQAHERPYTTDTIFKCEVWDSDYELADQILALLPSIEEAKREERERIINALKMVGITLREDWQGLQVHKEVLVPDPENKKAFWQALKGGE